MKNRFKVESIKQFIDAEGLKGDEVVERKQYTGEIKVMPDEERTIVARISTTDVDGDEDIVLPSGVDLKRFKLNPVIHIDHDYKVESVVGKALEIGTDEKGIVAKIKFADTPRANDVWQLVSKGFVKANSIGFIIKDAVYKGSREFDKVVKELGLKVADTCSRIVTKFELLESSIVSVPCNPTALIQAISAKSLELTPKTIETLDLPDVVVIEKGPACRQEDETKEECVSRKISEIMAEGVEQDQAVAMANSMCETPCEEAGKEFKKQLELYTWDDVQKFVEEHGEEYKEKDITIIYKPEVAEPKEEVEEEVNEETEEVVEGSDEEQAVTEETEGADSGSEEEVAEVAEVEVQVEEEDAEAEVEAKPERTITVISKPKSIKIVRKGALDIEAEARKRYLVKKGKIL